jgi:hypothetical protein
MAGEMILVNRRHRRRKKARARRHVRRARPRRRARASVAVRVNRRRRRVNARRHVRRRHHRNPRGSFRLPFLGSVNLPAIGAASAGYIGTRYGAGFALKMLPAEWGGNGNLSPGATAADANGKALARVGAKAVIGLGVLPLVAGMVKLDRKWVAIGAGVAIAADLFEHFVAPSIASWAPLADYEMQALSDYEFQGISGSAAGAYGGGAYSKLGAY